MELKVALAAAVFTLISMPKSWASSVKDCENMQIQKQLWSAAKTEVPAEDQQRCSMSVDNAKACCVERQDKQPNGENCYRNGGGVGGSDIYVMFKQCLGSSENVEHDCRGKANAKKLSIKLNEISKCYWKAEEQARKAQPHDDVGCLPTSDPNSYCYQYNPAPAGGGARK